MKVNINTERTENREQRTENREQRTEELLRDGTGPKGF